MSEVTLIKTIKVHNTLGECILWDEINQCTWWTDIHNAVLYRYYPEKEALEKYALPERLCSFGFIENDERLICAFESGFALYNPKASDLEWLYKPEEKYTGTRFNDGRVDRQGRFWSGTMVEADKATDENGNETLASLYWVAGDNTHGKALSDIQIPNSLCWSLDSNTVYFADSPTQKILAYDFDAKAASFSNPREFISTAGESAPDGSMIDADGCLWNAQFGGSKVVRYSPQGETLAQIDLPVTQPTCVCLGGPDMNLLFVTTARENLSEEQLKEEPEAGNVFIFQTSCKGLHESRFERI